MIYSIIISGIFFLCRLTLIQTISEYQFSFKEIMINLSLVTSSLLLYSIGYRYLQGYIFLFPFVLVVIGIIFTKKRNFLLIAGLSMLGLWDYNLISRVCNEEILKQTTNLLSAHTILRDGILIGTIGGLGFFFIENVIYAVSGVGGNIIFSRSLITAVVHLVSAGLFGYSLDIKAPKSLIFLFLGLIIHILFNRYIATGPGWILLFFALFCFILLSYLLQLSNRLYLIKLSG